MLKICLVIWESEPQYAYKRYAYKKNMYFISNNSEIDVILINFHLMNVS